MIKEYKRDWSQLPRKFHSFKWKDHELYNTWHGMKARCYDKNLPQYEDWGGRGIIVCDEWLFDFEKFVNDMGEKPKGDYSIHRVDNDGDYKPDNCKWVHRKEQNQVKRVYKTSKTNYSGVSLTNLGHYKVRSLNENRITLGVFITLDEALEAQRLNVKQTKPRVTNTTGVKGVTKQGDKYLVRKVVNGKRIYLGNTRTLNEAKILYEKGTRKEKAKREN